MAEEVEQFPKGSFPKGYGLAMLFPEGQTVAVWSDRHILLQEWTVDEATGIMIIRVVPENAMLRFGQQVKCPGCGEWVGPSSANEVFAPNAYCGACKNLFPVLGAERNPEALAPPDDWEGWPDFTNGKGRVWSPVSPGSLAKNSL